MTTNVAQALVQGLVDYGITQVFSVTGGGAMFLNQAFAAHRNLQCTYMHHEQACAMAAEGYARLTGKPAVVVVTTGPGAINAFNGVFGAFTDSVPMLVVSGQVKRDTCLEYRNVAGLRQLGDQEGPTLAMARPICKWAQALRTPEDLRHLLADFYGQAVSGRPGPTWLDVPLDVQSAPWSGPPVPIGKPHTTRPSPCASDVDAVARRLISARRPLLLAGTGVRLSGAQQSLLALAEMAQIPVATAWTHDLIASDHPLFAGRPGTIGTRAGNFCLQAADVLVIVGSRLNIRQTSYNFESFARAAWKVQVDIDPAELSKPGAHIHHTVCADAKSFLDALRERLAHEPKPDRSAWVGWCQHMRQHFSARSEHQQKMDAPINPYVAVARIFDCLQPQDVVVCGNASACILPFQVGDLKAGQRMFSNSGAASMGYDLPAALGAARGLQQTGHSRVICFAGDGSLMMNLQELQTLSTQQLPVIVVVINNGGYLSIRQTHENFFGRVVGATPESGVGFPDFARVGAAFGLQTHVLDKPADLDRLPQILQGCGPMLIELRVDERQNFQPRMKSRVDEQGRFHTPELDDMFPFLDAATLQAVRASAPS